ncbi:MAG: hypothetical protein V1709_08660 [Planctomycetota bacterium]
MPITIKTEIILPILTDAQKLKAGELYYTIEALRGELVKIETAKKELTDPLTAKAEDIQTMINNTIIELRAIAPVVVK